MYAGRLPLKRRDLLAGRPFYNQWKRYARRLNNEPQDAAPRVPLPENEQMLRFV